MAPQTDMPDLYAQAVKQFPILKNYDIGFAYSPGKKGVNPDFGLESFPPGEQGDPGNPRPQSFAPNAFGVEVYKPTVTPSDVMADVVSHYLVNVDPKVGAYYKKFQGSLTPDQKNLLKEQYEWAVRKEGEDRPYSQWEQAAGLPAYFRGYPFKQWPQEFNQKYYTAEQMKMFDQMMKELSAPPDSGKSSTVDKSEENKSIVKKMREAQ